MRPALFILIWWLGLSIAVSASQRDFEAGYTAHARGDYRVAIEHYSRAINSGDLSTKRLTRAYNNRGSAYSSARMYQPAISDYTESLRLNPDNEIAYYNRGLTHFFLGDFGAARNDFRAAMEIGPADFFRAIWLYLAQARLGEDTRAQLARHATVFELNDWTEPVLDLFLGQGSIQAVVDAAKDADSRRQMEKSCVAAFYVGQYMLIQSRDSEAPHWFRTAVDSCATSFVEHTAASIELERLGLPVEPAASQTAPIDTDTPPPTREPLEQPAPPRLFVATANVSFRSGPGTEHERLGVISAGNRVAVNGSSGGWYRVQIANGEHAFIHSDFLREIAPPAAPATEPQPVPRLNYLTTANVNYRTGPGTQYERLGVFARDTRITVDGEQNGWVQVALGDGSHAFVHGNYVRPAP